MNIWSGFSRFALGASLSILSISCGPAFAEETPPMARQLLMKKAVPVPAGTLETRLIRVQFPPGYKTPLHTHEGPGPRYVVKGHLRVEESGVGQVYGPGDVFWETGSPMTVENTGGSDAELVIFELAPGN